MVDEREGEEEQETKTFSSFWTGEEVESRRVRASNDSEMTASVPQCGGFSILIGVFQLNVWC
jgi:hypothetical protein